jgi:hypothetical protein
VATFVTAYVLWTRSDTGQAALWRVDPNAMPASGTGTIPLTSSAFVRSTSGVGGPWEATSYQYVNPTAGYVLWTRGDTGQAALWKVDPSAMPASGTGVIPLTSSAYLLSTSGVGAHWRATSFEYVDANTAYVLWTRDDTGQAALWKVDPGAMPASGSGILPITSSAYIRSTSGVGGPWQATSCEYVDAATAYVLWTRSDTGQAALWKVDPGAMPASGTGLIPVTSSAYLSTTSGVGGPWEATSYEQVSANEGYVLWTRSDTGQAALWKVDPGTMPATGTGLIPVASGAYLAPPSGVGKPWKASGFTYGK